MRDLLSYLTLRGKEANLTFSGCEFLKDTLIGLDKISRKLLIIRRAGIETYDEVLVNLDEVKSCSIKKVYGSIKAGDLKKRKLEQLLHQISLHLDFSDNRDSLEITFFEYPKNDSSQRPELEQKATHWGSMLSGMLRAPVKEIA